MQDNITMATQQTSDQEHGRITTVVEYWQANGAWHATEPESDREVVGRGETAPLAVKNYAEAIEDMAARDDSASGGDG